MKIEFSDVVKNALFAMVDLFLDFASEEDDVYSQRGNISEFIIDCHNLAETDAEFALLQQKFEEEFRETEFYSQCTKEEVIDLFEDSIEHLLDNQEIPQLIKNAMEAFYEGDQHDSIK